MVCSLGPSSGVGKIVITMPKHMKDREKLYLERGKTHNTQVLHYKRFETLIYKSTEISERV